MAKDKDLIQALKEELKVMNFMERQNVLKKLKTQLKKLVDQLKQKLQNLKLKKK